MAVNVKSFVLFERIPLLQQKVQLGALRAAPGAASLPRTGRGEALVQQHFHKSSSLTDSHNPPFSPGGSARRPAAPPPRRRRRAALGPMPYGNRGAQAGWEHMLRVVRWLGAQGKSELSCADRYWPLAPLPRSKRPPEPAGQPTAAEGARCNPPRSLPPSLSQ